MTAVPLGPIVSEVIRHVPGFERHVGKAVTLEPLSTRHVDDLWEAGHAADMSWAYHRVVWRCNALNAASMRAARRFGFTYEGTWRGDGIVKGRRRDTAWFSTLEREWPARRALFETWLGDSNFDADGVALSPSSPST